MDCQRARTLLLDRARGRLSSEEAASLDAHLEGCDACRRAADVERVTDELLARRPVHRAPSGLEARLRERIEAELPAAPATSATPARRRVSPLFWLAAAAVVLAIAAGFLRNRADDRRVAETRLVDEAVNDHLRILYSEHPLDVQSGGIHQVKPWFLGKIDFAPMKVFEGDEDLPLQGGSVAVMVDRKAAAFVYKRRLHTVTLFVTRAAGLPWPPGTEPAGRVKTHVETVRGFSTVTWTEGELGYALVSDIGSKELVSIAAKMAPP